MSPQRLLDLDRRRVRSVPQQPGERCDETVGAKAALQHTGVSQGGADGRVVGIAPGGRDRAPLHLVGAQEAGVCGGPLDQYRTGAATANPAPSLGGRLTEIVAEQIEPSGRNGSVSTVISRSSSVKLTKIVSNGKAASGIKRFLQMRRCAKRRAGRRDPMETG